MTENWHSLLFVEFDKPDRLRALAKVAKHIDERRFWPLFGQIWVTSESLYLDQTVIAKMLRKRKHSPYRGLMMSSQDRRALRALPEVLTIYRGCFMGNSGGWSWTLDFDKAVWFANRFPADGRPIVVEATIAKTNVIAYLSSRDEKEIIVDPEHVDVVKVHRLPRKQLSGHAALFQAVQAGRILADAKTNDISMELMLNAHRKNGTSLNTFLTEADNRIARFRRYGFTEEARRWSRYKQIAVKVYADGYVPPFSRETEK